MHIPGVRDAGRSAGTGPDTACRSHSALARLISGSASRHRSPNLSSSLPNPSKQETRRGQADNAEYHGKAGTGDATQMTTAAPARAPTPRLKAPPTSSTSSEPATAFMAPRPPPTAPPASTAAPLAPAPRRSGRPGPSDPLSDKTTSFLVRRVLCPQQLADKGQAAPAPIEELLPPLTSRNDVDLQLYAIIAITVRDSVQNWYNKITPDEAFVAEIVQIIAHCTRALEQRLRKVDLESLLFDEIPELLDNHVQGMLILSPSPVPCHVCPVHAWF